MRAIVTSSGCWLGFFAAASMCLAESTAPVSVEWRLIENRPDNSYHAELTIRNDLAKPLPGRWSLYFNSSSRLLADSVAGPLALEHINGDFYALRPAAEGPPLAAGAECTATYTGSPFAINISDAPSGFYFVAMDETGTEELPAKVALTVAAFPVSKLVTRGAADQVAVVTPALRFTENEKLQLLPLAELPRVLPTPIRTTTLKGSLALNSETVIVHDLSLASEAKYLADVLGPLLGTLISTTSTAQTSATSSNAIHLRIGAPEVAGTVKTAGEEAYRLTVDVITGVEIVGSDAAGVFYGIQSLRALLPLDAYRQSTPELMLEAVSIEDGPRFRYRGMHLDVARNFQSKDTVKKLLDVMAFYKLNRFHWHLTDDEGWRIEIKALPELTAVGGRRGHTLDEVQHLVPSLGSGPFVDADHSAGSGYYSQDDLIEILKFAAERHIEVIPELDFPGHSRAAIKAMAARVQKLAAAGQTEAANEFLLADPADRSKYESVQMWHDNVIDVGLESSYKFLDVVIGELADIYRSAGMPLEIVHLGGDEVPEGAWNRSPACQAVAIDTTNGLSRNQQLQLHFFDRACEVLAKHGIRPAIWEDCLLFATADGRNVAELRDNSRPRPIVYVWNNVWGWGREDAAYRLANAGYDVVLCNATHLYLDLVSEKDPDEIGYYWAGFVGERLPFEFNPLDVFQNAGCDSMGRPLVADQFASRVRLTDAGRHHILGIQGELWGENLRSPEQLEYMAFPRTIAVAERAWSAEPAWTTTDEPPLRAREIQAAWNRFANALGQRELPRLDYLSGGINYRLPPPGMVVRNDKIEANVAFPGMTIRYAVEGKEPNSKSPTYEVPLPLQPGLQLKTFNLRGRGSRTVTVPPQSTE